MIEVTTKTVKVVNSLDEAWTFVLGATENTTGVASVSITPFWDYGDHPTGTVKFEATVSVHESLEG